MNYFINSPSIVFLSLLFYFCLIFVFGGSWRSQTSLIFIRSHEPSGSCTPLLENFRFPNLFPRSNPPLTKNLFAIWQTGFQMRKREDLNLRYPFGHTTFRVWRLQPLSHASLFYCNGLLQPLPAGRQDSATLPFGFVRA